MEGADVVDGVGGVDGVDGVDGVNVGGRCGRREWGGRCRRG